jgi:peptidoglycan/LPS O-acetylase OafA/YrhL
MRSDSYRPDIQGLRAIAVLVVMLFHFNPLWLPGGFVGVDVFLVISGYLITRILLDKKAQPDYRLSSTLRYFYISRIKRITPAYFTMLVLVSLLTAVLFLPQDLVTYKKGLNQAAWFNSNHYFAGFGDYFTPANHEQPLLHTWSLAVEIQFYLLAPVFVLLLPARALKWLLTILLVGLTAMAEYRIRVLGIQQATYYSLFARLPEFFAGALMALSMRSSACWGRGKPWLSSLGLALVLVSAAALPLLGAFPGLAALLPVLGAALVLQRPPQGVAGQLLVSTPMVWLGQLSYSLYLWHWPVLALLRYYTGTQVLGIPSGLMFIIFTFLLATLSYYWVETPLREQHNRLKQTLAYGLLASAILATSPSMAKINQALSPAPLPVEYLRYADPATICHGQIVGDCLKGDLSSNKEVLVLGDSHAAMLNLFFDQLGKQLGFKARIITASSCVTIPGFDYQRIPEYAQKDCLSQIQQARKYLPNAKVIFLGGMWSWQLTSNDFHQALDAFLSAQSKAGIRVYLMEQEPMLSRSPMRALRFKRLGVESSKVNIDPIYQQTNAKLQGFAANNTGAMSLGLAANGFFAEAPFADGMLIYMDEHHLNEVGAEKYADSALRAFKKVMD